MLLHIDTCRACFALRIVTLGHLVEDALNVAQLRVSQVRLLVIRQVKLSLIDRICIYGATASVAPLTYIGLLSIALRPVEHVVIGGLKYRLGWDIRSATHNGCLRAPTVCRGCAFHALREASVHHLVVLGDARPAW